MTSSFAASLRKLAEEAAEAKRLMEAKARAVEKIVRAEGLRIKREAEVLARKEFRRAENEESKQREEAERLRSRAMRLEQLCSAIYAELAVAVWEGVEEAVVDDDALNFKSELIAMGVLVIRRNKLARLANNALADLLKAIGQFSLEADTPHALGLSTRLNSMSLRLQKSGDSGLSLKFSKLAGQFCSNLANEYDRIELSHSKVLDDIAGRKTAIAKIESEIRPVNVLLNEVQNQAAQRSRHLVAVAAEIKSHADDIGSTYQAHLPQGIAANKLSPESKASALRLAFATYVHGTDFKAFSELEIINLMRIANGWPLLESLDSADDTNCDRFRYNDSSEGAQAQLLKRLNRNLASVKSSLSSMLHKAKQLSTDLKNTKARLKTANEFGENCIQFEEVFARTLEGVNASQLRFDGDQYVGPTIAALGAERPVANGHLQSAYRELRWLAADDGRVFADYLDIVLSELAKEGARRVEVAFVDSDSEKKVEVGKISLVCNIGCPLMGLLFSKRGMMTTAGTAVSDDRTVFQLSW